jgi:curli biogenesis system outer membrane secretion channel CsgG
MKRLLSLFLAASCVIVAGTAVTVESAGNLRYSISVAAFPNESGWHGQWDVGDGFSTIMTAALDASDHFIVLGDREMREEALREQDFAASGRTAGGKKAPKTGRMTPAQLLVRGSLTHVQHDTTGGGGGIGFKGVRIGGSKGSAEVNFTVYLENTETGQVVASTKVIGKSGRKGLSLGYSGSALGGLTGDMAGFKKDNLGKATEDAVAQTVEFLTQQLEKIPWEGTVVLVKPDQLVINRGTREGVTEGMMFEVGTVEELVDPDTGEVLDTELTRIATIQAMSVKEKIAYCKVVDGGGKVAKGMSFFPTKR